MWSVLGYVLPLCVAFVAIPRLLHSLGDERFGLLTLFWVLAGYFNILDLGVGRALILAFSRLKPLVDRVRISSIFWIGGTILLLLGFAMSFAIQLLAGRIADLLGVAPSLREEAVGAIRIVGWTMPTTMILPALVALPTAFQRQKGLSILRIPAGIASHLVPLLMVSWTHDLRDLMWANLALRIVLLVAHAVYARMVHPLDWPPREVGSRTRELLATSSWMMLTNMLAPLLMNLDRLLISHASGPAALSCYAPAMELASKLLVLVGVTSTVLFPALGHHVANNPDHAGRFYHGALRSIGWWSPPFALLIAAASRPALILWLGPAHGSTAGILLSIFVVGVMAGLPGLVSVSAVQACGDSRRASFVHLAELPVYTALIWIGIQWGGVLAVAWIWSTRHLIDSLAMHALVRHNGLRSDDAGAIFLPLGLGMALVGSTAILHSLSAWMGCIFGLCAASLWTIAALTTSPGRNALPGFARRWAGNLGIHIAP